MIEQTFEEFKLKYESLNDKYQELVKKLYESKCNQRSEMQETHGRLQLKILELKQHKMMFK